MTICLRSRCMRPGLALAPKGKNILARMMLTGWFALAATQPSSAQTPMALSEVLAEALRNSSDVARIDRDLALRLADAIEVETRANPEVDVLAKYSEKGDGTGLEVDVSQPLRFSDFTLRPLYAAALRQTATVEQEAGVLI